MGDRRQDILTKLHADIIADWRRAAPEIRARTRPGKEWATVAEIGHAWGLRHAMTTRRLGDMERAGKAERRKGHPADWWRLK